MAVVNAIITDTLILRDYANLAITGKATADFQTAEAYATGTPLTTAVVAVAEIGLGEYRFSFTPTTAASWTGHIVYSAGGIFREFIESYDVLSKPATVVVVPTDPTSATGAAASSDLVTRGDTKIWNLPLTDSAGDLFDLTGCTVWFSVKQRFNLPDTDAIVKSSWVSGGASNGITVDDPASGWIAFGLTAEQSSELIASLYVADVQVLDTNDTVRTVWKLRLAVGAGTTARVTVP